MNIFIILAIIFGVLLFFPFCIFLGTISELRLFSDEKKQKNAFYISLPLIAVFAPLFITFLVICINKTHNAEMQELFSDNNYKEKIEYLDFVNIDDDKSEITYSKNGAFFTMQYDYKADDFEVKDGIQVYVDSAGTIGIR